MATKSETIFCETLRCKEDFEKYGERYQGVYEDFCTSKIMFPDTIAACQRCGGNFNGKEWKHICQQCKKDVNPGELTGLFVPHKCKECLQATVEQEKKAGNFCGMCGKVRSCCYC